jgi:hypothetical protein
MLASIPGIPNVDCSVLLLVLTVRVLLLLFEIGRATAINFFLGPRSGLHAQLRLFIDYVAETSRQETDSLHQ